MPQVWMALSVSIAFAAQDWPVGQCNIEEAWAGQTQVAVPGCKGVGCNANGQDWDCAWCIFDINKCESAYKHVCKETKAARDAQIVSCSDPSMLKNIVELVEGIPALSTFVSLLHGHGDSGGVQWIHWLSSPDPGGVEVLGRKVTVFAPTNDAFAALPTGVLDSLMKPENEAQLIDMMEYHVVEGAYDLKDFNGERTTIVDISTVEGNYIEPHCHTRSECSVNDAHIVTPDLMASNGVVHVVDGVLAPGRWPALEAAKPNIVELAESCDCSCWGGSYHSQSRSGKAVCVMTQPPYYAEKCCSKSDILV